MAGGLGGYHVVAGGAGSSADAARVAANLQRTNPALYARMYPGASSTATPGMPGFGGSIGSPGVGGGGAYGGAMGAAGTGLPGNMNDLLQRQLADNAWSRQQNLNEWNQAKGNLLNVPGQFNNDPLTQGSRNLAMQLQQNPEAINDMTQQRAINRASNLVNASANARLRAQLGDLASAGQLGGSASRLAQGQVNREREAQLAGTASDLETQRAIRRNQDITGAATLSSQLAGQANAVNQGVANTYIQNLPQFRADDYSGLMALYAGQGGGGGMGGNGMNVASHFASGPIYNRPHQVQGGGGGGIGLRDQYTMGYDAYGQPHGYNASSGGLYRSGTSQMPADFATYNGGAESIYGPSMAIANSGMTPQQAAARMGVGYNPPAGAGADAYNQNIMNRYSGAPSTGGQLSNALSGNSPIYGPPDSAAGSNWRSIGGLGVSNPAPAGDPYFHGIYYGQHAPVADPSKYGFSYTDEE